MKIHSRRFDLAFGDRSSDKRGAITSHYVTLLDGFGSRQILVWLTATLRMHNHTRVEAHMDFTAGRIVKGSVVRIGKQ